MLRLPTLGDWQMGQRRKVQTLFGAALIGYWKLAESSGTTAFDSSGNGRNGTTSGALVGQPGIGDGLTSYWFDGSNDVIDVFSASLGGAFNGAEGAVMGWAKVNAAGVWTDTVGRHIFKLRTGTTSEIAALKNSTNNDIRGFRRVGATFNTALSTFSSTSWFHFALTWSASGSRVTSYVNGAVGQAINVSLPAWTGAVTVCNIGAGVGADYWNGWLAHVAMLNREATAAEIAKAATL
jgi:hypothetical protein